MTEETTKNEIRIAVRAWLAGFNSKNKNDFFNLFHPDAIYANDGTPLMCGLSEIKPWYDKAFEMTTNRALFKEEAIVAEGDMAFAVGKFYMEPAEGDESPGEAGRVVLIYRRNEQGKWLLSYDMDNRPPDALPENFANAGADPYLEA